MLTIDIENKTVSGNATVKEIRKRGLIMASKSPECPYCGSLNIQEKVIWQGEKDYEMLICKDCMR